MSDHLLRHRKVIHMAGIVPVAAPPMEFKFPWPDSMLPIAPDYLAVERAVYECALAGCETIWIVCHFGVQPILRKVIGDYITDPVSLTIGLNPSLKQRVISIFYIPIKPKDKNKKDSLGWSFLYGADTAFRVSAVMSKWMVPRKFYCAFPYGIMPEDIIWKSRRRIGYSERTIFTYQGKTVKDNLHISFTMNEEQFKICRDSLKKKMDHIVSPDDKKIKDMSLQEIYKTLEIIPNETIEIPWFYDISNWDNYTNFITSEECKNLVKNKQCFLKMKRKLFPGPEEKGRLREDNKQNIKEEPAIIDDIEMI